MRRFALIASAVLLGLSVLPAAIASPAGMTSSACWLAGFKAGDADATAACYAPDAVMWFPGGPVAKGRDAIRAGYVGYFTTFTIKEATLSELGSKSLGDSVATWGTFKIVMSPKAGGDDVTEVGRYTDVSQKIGGKWMYIVDHASDEPAAPAATPAAPAT